MTKNGSFATKISFADITGWTADTSTYPGSSVNSNTSLVAQAAKSGATLTANIPFSGGIYTFGTGTRYVFWSTAVSSEPAPGNREFWDRHVHRDQADRRKR